MRDDRFGYARKGTFRCRIKTELLFILLLTGAVAAFMMFILNNMFGSISDVTMNNTISKTVFDFISLVVVAATPFVYIGALRTILSGEEYSFKADEKKMLIVCPRRGIRADILYSNVRNIQYRDIIMFTKHRGYTVTVTCTDGTYVFDYLFPYKSGTIDKSMTPFGIIEEYIGMSSSDNDLYGR